MNLQQLQFDVLTWHKKKYGEDWQLIAGGNKLAEETGEACRAIDRIHHATSDLEEVQWEANLGDELGDIVLVALVIAARRGSDFESLIERRAAEVMAR